jgi:8-amino-7-oxononanoate synthase
MSERNTNYGLSTAERSRLVERLKGGTPNGKAHGPFVMPLNQVPHDDLANSETYKQMEIIRSAAETLGIANPFFRVHGGVAGAESTVDGRVCLNFSSYNYLGFNGHPRVTAAAQAAIAQYGTSCSASRLVAGERPPHRELEQRLAALHGAEDCVAFVSGHATNVTVIGNMLGKADLILYDAFSHNSVQQGAQLSGARRLSFPHNDIAAAERLLLTYRPQHGRALIVIEGHYSMDGDIPDLPAFSDLARRHRAWLLVDEAHSIGVLGPNGRGIGEHFGLGSDAVDFWMGTLSKTLAGCGGYIACRRDIAEYLRYSAPGFVYSVGMPPPMAAAAAAALDLLAEEPERVARLQANARRFLDAAKAAGLDTGLSRGFAIVPIIVGSSIAAGRLSAALYDRGINVQPILYPAVPERAARLRFFLSSEHTVEQIDDAVAVMAQEERKVRATKVDLAALAATLQS